ncbi:ACP S-malonyltransferase [Chloroflexi bacterium TSY]|nr:ACP S-malonyltransferase [Chloroflexi bacterium TSY]
MSTFECISAGPPTLYMFPGQGEQHVGMVQELADQYEIAKLTMEEADDVLGFKLSRLCFEGPEEELTDTLNAQPAMVAASIATLRVLNQLFLQEEYQSDYPEQTNTPSYVAGHSLGEYTALVAAGSLSFPDGLRLVRERGRLMKEAGKLNPGRMAAILGLDNDIVESVCSDITDQRNSQSVVQVANYNCSGQVVISGTESAVNQAMDKMKEAGARKVVALAVSIAAHSPLMQPAVDELRSAIDRASIADPMVQLIANTSARALKSADEIREELLTQLTGHVRWSESVQTAINTGINLFVEVGPGNTLASLAKRIQRKSNRYSLNESENIQSYVKQVYH